MDMERDLIFLSLPERTAVWDAVAGYIQQQLLLCQVGQHVYSLSAQRGGESPRAWGMACSYSSPSQKVTPKASTDGQQCPWQGWYHLW